MKKNFLMFVCVIILCISVFSCVARIPISNVVPHNNESYRVQYLFEHDGCKVYRFWDDGHYVYFTHCRGTVSSIENDSVRITTQVY